ncbi:hypothetical protein ACJX0J_009678, partial [Zea mays]
FGMIHLHFSLNYQENVGIIIELQYDQDAMWKILFHYNFHWEKPGEYIAMYSFVLLFKWILLFSIFLTSIHPIYLNCLLLNFM